MMPGQLILIMLAAILGNVQAGMMAQMMGGGGGMPGGMGNMRSMMENMRPGQSKW